MASTIAGASEVARASGEAEIDKLHAKIGQLVVERDFCQGLRSMRVDRRRGLVEATHPDLSVSAQCRLLSISRSSFCYGGLRASRAFFDACPFRMRAIS